MDTKALDYKCCIIITVTQEYISQKYHAFSSMFQGEELLTVEGGVSKGWALTYITLSAIVHLLADLQNISTEVTGASIFWGVNTAPLIIPL